MLETVLEVRKVAFALAKGRTAGHAYVEQYVREAVASGKVEEWVRRSGVKGVRVAAR